MNNHDTSQRLISLAKEYYDELVRAYNRESWNVVVRHSQEVVELCLKGLLKMMGVEYPKSHDVGNVFEIACNEMDIDIALDVLNRLKDISLDLAKKRSPAFYLEIIYTKQNAEKAKVDAEFVLDFTETLSQHLRTGH